MSNGKTRWELILIVAPGQWYHLVGCFGAGVRARQPARDLASEVFL